MLEYFEARRGARVRAEFEVGPAFPIGFAAERPQLRTNPLPAL